MTTVTIGPSQPLGRRTIADANGLGLTTGDTVKFESIDESGPFLTSTRLAVTPGVRYTSLDPGHKWGITGLGGIDVSGDGATVEWFKGDGQHLSGSQGVASGSQARNFTLQDYELCNYQNEAIKSRNGQWQNFLNSGNANSGPDDTGWLVQRGYHHDNGLAGTGTNDWFHYGAGLVVKQVAWRNTGAGDHAFYPKARGLRMSDCLFDQCANPLSFRCGDQLAYRIYLDGCTGTPVSFFPYDKTGLGGKSAIYGMVFRRCSDAGVPGGGALIFLDYDNHESGSLHQQATIDWVLYAVTALDSTTAAQLIDFRDLTAIAGRSVKLRNIAHGKNITAPYRTGYTAAKLDSDYNAYPNGGKPAGETHSITPSTLTVSEATWLPTSGSALLGVGTTAADGTDYTPRKADIGFQGYPAPASSASPISPLVDPVVAATGTSATPGGTFTPGSAMQVGDVIVYALAFNQNNLADLVVTPPSGYTLQLSRSNTNRNALYVATRQVVSGDTLSGAITLPTWHIQDGTAVDQSRGYVTIAAVLRGADPTAIIPSGGTSSGANTASATTGNSGTTAITTPRVGSYLFGVAVAKPGQSGVEVSLDDTNSLPTPSLWVKKLEQLHGTAGGSAGDSVAAFAAALNGSTASQAKLAVTFATTAQWLVGVLEFQPPAGGSTGDTTAPDVPNNLHLDSLAGTTAIVQLDATDYGAATTGGGGPGGGGTAWATPGSPVNWWKLTQDGGIRPSFDSWDPTALFGPVARTYYDNASLRAVDRGTAVTNQRYYPRSLGIGILAIDFSDHSHFKITLDTAPPSGGAGAWSVGATVQVLNCSSLGGTGHTPMDKKPNGAYVIQSISGQVVTFTTGAKTTSGDYNPDSGFAILESQGRTDTVYTIDVAEANIGSASDGHGPLFLPKFPALATSTRGTPANPWVLQAGRCNFLQIKGVSSALAGGGIASLAIEIPPWFEVTNSGADYVANGINADPQLLNPFCHVEFSNCHLNVVDGIGLRGMCGGVSSYSDPLGTLNLVIPSGEALGWGGCSGVIRGAMNHDFCYDANKFGGGAANLRWERCSNFRNRMLVVSGGGHTDGYQVFDLHNDLLKSISGAWTDPNNPTWTFDVTPTWYRCYFESGGNAMLFLNYGGAAAGSVLNDLFVYECIAGTGNKFFLTAGVHNAAARRNLVNNVVEGVGGMIGKRPDPHDYGANDGTGNCSPDGAHPCPTGNLGWPSPSSKPEWANLDVNLDGSTTPIDRQIDGSSKPCLDTNGCFTWTD